MLRFLIDQVPYLTSGCLRVARHKSYCFSLYRKNHAWAAATDDAVDAEHLLTAIEQTTEVSWPENLSKGQFFASVPLPNPSRCTRVLDLHPAEPSRPNSPLTG
jgi:hypothetical protein